MNKSQNRGTKNSPEMMFCIISGTPYEAYFAPQVNAFHYASAAVQPGIKKSVTRSLFFGFFSAACLFVLLGIFNLRTADAEWNNTCDEANAMIENTIAQTLLDCKVSASAEEYDPAAIALLEKIKKENISPRFPFLWPGSDSSRWQGVTWSDERPRRLEALTFPYADYDRHQGPIFHQRGGSPSLDIHDIAGLERLTINVGDSLYKIHNLPDLKVLDLKGGKQLSLEHLTSLPNLRELDLSWRFQDNILFNPAKLHHLRVLKGLQSLKLSYTSFSKPGIKEVLSEVLKSLPELRELDLAGQNLTTLDALANLPLTSLNLAENPIQSLAGLEALTELRHLDLSYTPLKGTSGLSGLTKLESLIREVRAHVPTRISVQGLAALTELKKLSLGPVYPIEEDLAPLVRLEELHLSLCDAYDAPGNRKKQPDDFNTIGSLIGLKNLKWLDIQCLDLEYAFLPLLERLDRFDLKRCERHSGNSLHLKVLSPLKNIKQIKLQGNSIVRLDGLAGLDSLTHLDLSVNKIVTTLGLTDMKSLTRLNLARNQLLRLDGLANLSALEELDLQGNQLTDLNWEEIPAQIRDLNLGKNMFYRIDKLGRLTRLEELNLSGNPLADFSGLREASASLKSLDLSKTKFTNLTLLQDFKNLENLNLEECEISGSVDLSYWPNLKELNIKNNRITSISGWESLPEGAVIDVACNSLPLSLLFQLQEDSRHSGRQWRMGWSCGFSRMPQQFSQWDVFESKEVKVGEIYDLSQEAVLGGIKTRFRTGEPSENKTKRRNNFPWIDYRTLHEAVDPNKPHPGQEGAVCTEDQGRFIFSKPGRYIIIMENPRVGYSSPRFLFGSSILQVATSSIIVK